MNSANTSELADVYFVLGMADDDKALTQQAIEAFTRAVEVKAGNDKARFQRGQDYVRLGDVVNAKQDLEAFVTAAARQPALAFEVAAARAMLVDLAQRPTKK